MIKTKTLFVYIPFVAILLLPSQAYVRSGGGISGVVTAVSGKAPVPDASVTAINEQSREYAPPSKSDRDGNYTISDLPDGSYTLKVERDGFKEMQKSSVGVSSNKNTKADLDLEIALVAISIVPVIGHSSGLGDLTGLEIATMARVGQGGQEVATMQYLTARGEGFIYLGQFTATGSEPVTAAGQIRVSFVDYQDSSFRRRLDVMSLGGARSLVFTRDEGGFIEGVINVEIAEPAVARQWAMIGFATSKLAADRQLKVTRQMDNAGAFVTEVELTPLDTIRFWINKSTFLIDRVFTLYKGKVLIEEYRGDYRRVGGCVMLPYRIVTKVKGQRFADITINSYDTSTVIPSARFTITSRE